MLNVSDCRTLNGGSLDPVLPESISCVSIAFRKYDK